jgi:hypothetical protein
VQLSEIWLVEGLEPQLVLRTLLMAGQCCMNDSGQPISELAA